MAYLINFALLVTLVIAVWYFVWPWLFRAYLKMKLSRGFRRMAKKHKNNPELYEMLMKLSNGIKNLD